MGITSACLPTLGPIASFIRHGRPVSKDASGRTLGSDRVTPDLPIKESKRKVSSRLSWANVKSKRPDSYKEDGSFTQLSDLKGDDDILKLIAPFTRSRFAEGTVEANARRSSSAQENDQPLNGIRVTTDMQQGKQDAQKLETIEDV